MTAPTTDPTGYALSDARIIALLDQEGDYDRECDEAAAAGSGLNANAYNAQLCESVREELAGQDPAGLEDSDILAAVSLAVDDMLTAQSAAARSRTDALAWAAAPGVIADMPRTDGRDLIAAAATFGMAPEAVTAHVVGRALPALAREENDPEAIRGALTAAAVAVAERLTAAPRVGGGRDD